MADTYITTKSVAQILGISEPSVRLHAQRMEKLGYTFQKWQNARQFRERDVRLIEEALKMNSETNHDLGTCFEYLVTRELEGQAAADEILDTQKPVVQRTDFLTKENEVYKDLKGDNEEILSLLGEIKNSVANSEEDESEAVKKELEAIEEEKARLQEELEAIKKMNYLEFRKWKKNN